MSSNSLGIMMSFLIFFLLLQALPPSTAMDGVCYKDSISDPLSVVSAGHYNPEDLMDLTVCMTTCGILDFQYCAFEEGKFCFCLSNVTNLLQVEDQTNCFSMCEGKACGGVDVPGVMSVYTVDVMNGDLNFTLDSDTFDFTVGETVSLLISGTEEWVVDWGDGTDYQVNATTHIYNHDGQYIIQAFLVPLPHISDSVIINMIGSPNGSLECPYNVTAGDGVIPTYCLFTTISQGNDLILTTTYTEPGVPDMTYTIPGELTQHYGFLPDTTSYTSAGSLTLGSAVMLHSNGARAGYVASVRVQISSAGWIVLYAVTPSCDSGTYCGIQGHCGSCSPTLFTHTCTSYLCSDLLSCKAQGCDASTPYASPPLWTYRVILSFFVSILDEVHTHLVEGTDAFVYEGEMLALGCLSDADCPEGILQLSMRDSHSSEPPLNILTILDPGVANISQTLLNKQYLGSVQVREHPLVNMDYELLCQTVSCTPTADVPQPFTADTVDYALNGTFSLNYSLVSLKIGEMSRWTHQAEIMCQGLIETPPVVQAASLWVPLLIPTNFAITFSEGAPVFSSLDLGYTTVYNYYDNATGEVWNVELKYPTTGTFLLNGIALNALSGEVMYNATMYVVPVLTNNWTVEAMCPCLAVVEGFNFTLNLPATINPPFMANITAVYINGVLVEMTEVDFGTSENGGVEEVIIKAFHTTVMTVGTYTVTFTLTNQVSNTTVNAQFVVEEGLAGIQSPPMTFLLGDTVTSAMGPLSNIIMYNTSITFTPGAAEGKASVEKWKLILQPSGEILDVIDGWNSTLSFIFNESMAGPQVLQVWGYNTVQGWLNSDNFTIDVATELKGFNLTDDGKVVEPNSLKILTASFDVLPPMSCIKIDYDDESPQETYGYNDTCRSFYPEATYMGPHSNPMLLQHNYTEEGKYQLNALARDATKTLPLTLHLVIATLPCSMPIVHILDKVPLENPAEFMRSVSYQLSTSTIINCTRIVPVRPTLVSRRWWVITEVDPETEDPWRDIVLEDKLASWNYSQLDIVPLFLPKGTYRLTYWVSIDASKIFPLMRSDKTYIRVTASPLEANIIEGGASAITRGYQRTVILSPGTLSKDPDEPEDKTFNFTWWCRQIAPAYETFSIDGSGALVETNKQSIPSPLFAIGNDGCFGNGPGPIDFSLGILELNTASFLLSTATYEMVVKIVKWDREAFAGVTLKITQDPPPIVTIKCANEFMCRPHPKGLLIDPTLRLALVGSCTEDCTANMELQWSITDINGNNVAEEENTIVCETCGNPFLTSKTGKDLAVKNDLFRLNPEVNMYLFKLTMETSTLAEGFAVVTVVLNKPPEGGQCTVTLTTLPALVTTTKVTCRNWKDPDEMGIKSYTFYYPTSDGNIQSMVSSTASIVTLLFPVGVFDLWVKITDVFDTSVEVLVDRINATMITKETFTAHDTSSRLQYLAAIGDQSTLGMTLVALASIRENADWLNLDPNSFNNMTEGEVDDRFIEVSNMNKQSLEFTLNTMDFATLGQLDVGVGVLTSSVCGVLNQEMAAYTIDTEFREKALILLKKMSNKLLSLPIKSPSEIKSFITSYLDAIDCFLRTMNIIILNPGKVSVTDYLAAGQWDYETNLGDDADSPDNLSREEQLKRNILKTTIIKAKFIVKDIFYIVNNMTKMILSKSVVGESFSSKSTGGTSCYITKVTGESLKDGLVLEPQDNWNSSVYIPKNYCPGKYVDSGTQCNSGMTVVGFSVMVWPHLTHVYSMSREHLSKKSNVVIVRSYVHDSKVEVTKESSPLIIKIPRISEEVPSPIYVNAEEWMNNKVPFVYHSINLTKPSSAFSVEIDFMGKSPQKYLVFVLDYERLPTPSKFEKIVYVNDLPLNENGTKFWFVNSGEIKNRTGRFFFAVASLAEKADLSMIRPDKEAGTDSNIQFIVSGEYDETDVRIVPPSGGQHFHRYCVDGFVMATPGPLGLINYLRIWHDNSGKTPFDGWQLEKVVIRDLQTRDKFVFHANCWLALDREEYKVDHVLTPSQRESDKSFSTDFYYKGHRSTNEDHMWISIFLRPTGSRFCRVERVLVAMAYLYLVMLVSAVWYRSLPNSPRNSFSILSIVTVYVWEMLTGLFASLMVYPVTMLFAFVLKRARPRRLKKCRALEALARQRQEKGGDSLIEVEEQDDLRDTYDMQTEPAGGEAKETSPVRCLPCWTRWLVWLLLLCCVGGSAFLVWSYGIMWGEVKTSQWFNSFITSFFISLLATQWLRVLFVTFISTLCCKNLGGITEDIDCDEELPELSYDEEWKKVQAADPLTRRKVHSVGGVDSTNPEVSALVTQLSKKREMKQVLQDIGAYCFFLLILFVLVKGKADVNAYYLQHHMSNTFVKFGHRELDFSTKIITANHLWTWIHTVILDEVRAQRWYNKEPPYGLRGFLDDRHNRIVGYSIIRQVRSNPDGCFTPGAMRRGNEKCSGRRGEYEEEQRDFCNGWHQLKGPGLTCKHDEFKFLSSEELETYSMTGKLGSYGGGGYVIHLNGLQKDDSENLKKIQELGWINKHTRAVILEFSTYNANVNLFTKCTVMAEFNEGGGITPTWSFEPIQLLREQGISGKVIMLCEVLFLVATVLFTLGELWKMKKLKLSYFTFYWNLAELSILLISYATVGIYFYRDQVTQAALKEFNETDGKGYIRMDKAVMLDQYYIYLLGFIVFFSILKLIKLLQFNKRMDVLALTIQRCWDELSVFFIAMGTVFFAFCCLFYFIYITHLEEFARFLPAVETSFKMILGKFDFEAMNQANSISPLLFFMFSVMMSMILINIMLTIILRAFNEVKIELRNRSNKYDVLNYLVHTAQRVIRREKDPNTSVNPDVTDSTSKNVNQPTNTDQLPDKVGQLMTYINNMYFDGRLDLTDKNTVRHMMQTTSYTPHSHNQDANISNTTSVISSD
ncbi:hypothetical protein Pmani_013883 [Petrolisthes manimaculis]|uniref:Uncharacterized protein n=1 Tax=Petrolisthes manimaculis TaxID=1843537 RepID=A0AAE1PWF2_9EUCA|nr:hypothetical protein Pmani_013883 [Petrolisthes manimaculis]